MKTCTVCRNTKNIDCFYKRAASPDGYATQCKTCDNERRKAWKEANPEANQRSSRNNQLLKRYGMTLSEYEELLNGQNGKCGICYTSENYTGHTGYRKDWSWSVDHCHKTGKIRGLLCNNCNRALGLFKDNKEVMLKALSWLDVQDV